MIKFLIMDVDGTLTDGKIYMSDNGEMFKAFDVKDGCGIKELLPKMDIIPVIITARISKIVENRSKELNISYVYQGCSDKLGKMLDIIHDYNEYNGTNFDLSNVVYIGDDITDLKCINSINKAGGFTACPKNSALELLKVVKYKCKNNGGSGAVRELIEKIKSEGDLQ